MKKKVMVLFSGGLDSTYLVYKNLTEGNEVKPIYIELLNNDSKSKVEIQQIKLLHEIFSNEYSNITDIIYPIKFESNSYTQELSLRQAPVWIFGMIYSGQLSEVDEIQVGYVMNDDAISYIEDFKRVYNSFKGLLNIKLPKLTFPLIKMKKSEIFGALPTKYRELTITCEMVKILYKKNNKIEYRLCGVCDSCKRQKKDGVWVGKDDIETIFAKDEIKYSETKLIGTDIIVDLNKKQLKSLSLPLKIK